MGVFYPNYDRSLFLDLMNEMEIPNFLHLSLALVCSSLFKTTPYKWWLSFRAVHAKAWVC